MACVAAPGRGEHGRVPSTIPADVRLPVACVHDPAHSGHRRPGGPPRATLRRWEKASPWVVLHNPSPWVRHSTRHPDRSPWDCARAGPRARAERSRGRSARRADACAPAESLRHRGCLLALQRAGKTGRRPSGVDGHRDAQDVLGQGAPMVHPPEVLGGGPALAHGAVWVAVLSPPPHLDDFALHASDEQRVRRGGVALGRRARLRLCSPGALLVERVRLEPRGSEGHDHGPSGHLLRCAPAQP